MQDQKKVDPEKKKQAGRWSKEEHQRFMQGIYLYGKNWKKVEQVVKTRTGSQVRSHAQKFFNKLQKQTSQTTPQKKIHRFEGEGNMHGSDSDKEFQQSLFEEGSNTTPIQIVSFIKNQSKETKKINLGNFKQKLELKMRTIQQEDEQNELEGLSLQKKNSYQSMNNILSAYEDQKPNSHEEDQSFLLGLTKRYKKFFKKGILPSLVDSRFESEHESLFPGGQNGKRSFTLPEGVQGDEHDLQERKKLLYDFGNQKIVGEQRLNCQGVLKNESIYKTQHEEKENFQAKTQGKSFQK